jgi:hypothetical protein
MKTRIIFGWNMRYACEKCGLINFGKNMCEKVINDKVYFVCEKCNKKEENKNG